MSDATKTLGPESYLLLASDQIPILQFFTYEHLPPHLQEVSKQFSDAAAWMAENIPDGAELRAGLRKLLEAKDCAVRARLSHDITQKGIERNYDAERHSQWVNENLGGTDDEAPGWEQAAMGMVEGILAESEWDFENGVVRLQLVDDADEPYFKEADTPEKFLDILNEAASSEWYANVTFDGGEAVFHFDDDMVQENLGPHKEQAHRMWPDFF
jgi:hypothetical protein